MTVLTQMETAHAWTLPLDKLKFKSLFQGATIAIDPSTKREYLFQAQAKATGPKDVEDLYISRFELTPTGLVYLDTLIGKKFGHIQTLHVRISALGNPWMWIGAEQYDTAGKVTGTQAYRVLYRGGRTATLQDKDSIRIHTGKGSVNVISSPEWKVWLRRAGSSVETYELFDEKTLTNWVSDTERPIPLKTIVVPRNKTTFQSACGTEDEILRVNGATENSSILTSSLFPDVEYDFTSAAPPGLRVTSEEPEAVFIYNGKAYVGKRFNSVKNRVVAYFRMG